MGGTGRVTIAAAYRSYVLALLDRDAAYDDDPKGDPPLTLADYRRALVAVLALDPSPLLVAGRWVTDTEATAFTAGQQAGLDGAVIAIGETWRPELLRRLDDDPSEHSADTGAAVDVAMAAPVRPGPMTWALAFITACSPPPLLRRRTAHRAPGRHPITTPAGCWWSTVTGRWWARSSGRSSPVRMDGRIYGWRSR